MRITEKIPAAGNAKDVETAVTKKYLSHLWRALEISSVNCEINLLLIFYKFC